MTLHCVPPCSSKKFGKPSRNSRRFCECFGVGRGAHLISISLLETLTAIRKSTSESGCRNILSRSRPSGRKTARRVRNPHGRPELVSHCKARERDRLQSRRGAHRSSSPGPKQFRRSHRSTKRLAPRSGNRKSLAFGRLRLRRGAPAKAKKSSADLPRRLRKPIRRLRSANGRG